MPGCEAIDAVRRAVQAWGRGKVPGWAPHPLYVGNAASGRDRSYFPVYNKPHGVIQPDACACLTPGHHALRYMSACSFNAGNKRVLVLFNRRQNPARLAEFAASPPAREPG